MKAMLSLFWLTTVPKGLTTVTRPAYSAASNNRSGPLSGSSSGYGSASDHTTCRSPHQSVL